MTAYRTLVDISQLKALAAGPGCRVVDCRFNLMKPGAGRQDYLAGHIPGAVFADLDHDLAGTVTANSGRHPLPAIADFVACIQNWGITNNTQVVVYDGGNGALAVRLWWMLRWLGHEKVALLDGGLSAWLAADGELENHEPDIAVAKFDPSPDQSLVATTEEISAAVAAGTEFNLLDARDAVRFAGQTEPIDPVAGHIPGAINLPLTRNINADGLWRSASELKQLWQDTLAGREGRALTTMCGSGVTACHLVLSAQIAGLPEPRVYVGSWSEWIRDDSRPVATLAANQE
ncbi:MAG: thiosulfate/3-mercaptopyruvate sulfurtransferase [Woeseiaceae bacterium]|jgi:thiosulfate/3-mercaptopyruvate sulfurtransferase